MGIVGVEPRHLEKLEASSRRRLTGRSQWAAAAMGDGDLGFDDELPRMERAAASGGKKRQRGCSSVYGRQQLAWINFNGLRTNK
jgi:hypothetical protein